MAKAATKTAKPAKKDKPKKKPEGGTKAKAKGEKKAKKAAPKNERHTALEALAKLADHPMVADLLAAGALAAVAAIAENKLDKGSSTKVVKTAGKAAAAAIGKKLMSEFGQIKDAATEAAKKA